MRNEDVSGNLRVFGQVVDENKRAVPDVNVRLAPGNRSTTTDAQGNFAFERLASRRYSLRATKDEFYAGPTVVRAVKDMEPAVLQLHRGSTLVVHVTADGAPVRGAGIYIDRTLAATTDKNGVATVRGLSPDFHDCWVTADGWANANIHSFVHDDPGGVIERFVTLRPGARVEGIAVGPNDVPVPDAGIVLWTMDGRFAAGATTDKKGAWRIEALEAGKFRVNARSENYCSDEPTTGPSDFSGVFIVGLGLTAFPTRPDASIAPSTLEISRFSCREVPYVHGVYDRAGPLAASRCWSRACCLPPRLTASAYRGRIRVPRHADRVR